MCRGHDLEFKKGEGIYDRKNKKLGNLYKFSGVVREAKSRALRHAEDAAHEGDTGNAYRILVEGPLGNINWKTEKEMGGRIREREYEEEERLAKPSKSRPIVVYLRGWNFGRNQL